MAPGSVMPRNASAIWPAPRYSSTFSTTARYSRASSRARSDGATSSSTGSTCTQRALPVPGTPTPTRARCRPRTTTARSPLGSSPAVSTAATVPTLAYRPLSRRGTRTNRPSPARAAARAEPASSLSTAMVTTIPGRTTPEVRGSRGRLRVWSSSIVPIRTSARGLLFLDAASSGQHASGSALPADAAALLGRGATPDAVGLAVPDGVAEALGAHRAGGADRQGLGLFVGRGRIEDLSLSAATGGLIRPGSLLHDRNNAAWEGAIS